LRTTKKTPARKAEVRKVPAKNTKKIVKPLSLTVCELVSKGRSDKVIVNRLGKLFPNHANNGLRAVKYYKKLIAAGKYEKQGFPASIIG